jgi:hypothetical protein
MATHNQYGNDDRDIPDGILDSEAIHIKLDELIRAIDVRTMLFYNLKNLGERELDRIRADYIRLVEEAREKL